MAKLRDFIELPGFENIKSSAPRRTLRRMDTASGKRASSKDVFLAQCMDHSISLLLSLSMIAMALSLFDGAFSAKQLGVSQPVFWGALVGLIFFNGLIFRLFMQSFLGLSLAETHLKIRPHFDKNKPMSSTLRHYSWEALQGAFPSLWLINSLLRLSHLELGASYVRDEHFLRMADSHQSR